MYLSKISLIPGRATQAVAQTLKHNGAYAEHQVLWQLFSDQGQRSFLFRQEQKAGEMEFFVLSETMPLPHAAFRVRTKAFSPRLYAGQKLAFNLRANPTVYVNRKRHDVLMHAKHAAKQQGLEPMQVAVAMEEAAQQWLSNTKRCHEWGVSLAHAPLVETYSQHQSRKKDNSIQFSSVDYQGVLTVIDPNRFWEQYRQGFGRAKALGCGLMLIRPL